MKKIYSKSLRLDLTKFHGKPFKVLCDAVRSGVKQEHGFAAQKGLTDNRLASWPIIIRFTANQNRERFIKLINRITKS